MFSELTEYEVESALLDLVAQGCLEMRFDHLGNEEYRLTDKGRFRVATAILDIHDLLSELHGSE